MWPYILVPPDYILGIMSTVCSAKLLFKKETCHLKFYLYIECTVHKVLVIHFSDTDSLFGVTVPPYVCLHECSCYSWPESDLQYNYDNTKLTCYANAGGYPVAFETELERQTVTDLLKDYFSASIWTNGSKSLDVTVLMFIPCESLWI